MNGLHKITETYISFQLFSSPKGFNLKPEMFYFKSGHLHILTTLFRIKELV